MTTATVPLVDRPADPGQATGDRTPPQPDDEVRFWALVDAMEDQLTQS